MTQEPNTAGPGPVRLSGPEWAIAALVTALAFAVFGTVTAVWPNPLFIRMTPTSGWDWVLLALESVLLGAYLGVRTPACGVGRAGAGGVLGFLGFGCPVCNQLLVLVFGAGFLLTYFEPVRYPVGALGVLLLALAVWQKLQRRGVLPLRSPVAAGGQ